MKERANVASASGELLPTTVVNFAIDRSAFDAFVDQVKQFGEANGFETRFAQRGPKQEHVLIELWRGTTEITGAGYPDTGPSKIILGFGFYETGDDPAAKQLLASLVSALKESVGRIPGVAIVDQP